MCLLLNGTDFSSRFKGFSKEMNKIAKKQSLIKNLIDTELSNVHKLEQEINCEIYGEDTYNTPTPCSLLKDTYVATATTSPELLSSDPRERLEIMKQVRGMSAKTKHQETLRKLQVPPKRRSRLQHKPRPDYTEYEYDDEY